MFYTQCYVPILSVHSLFVRLGYNILWQVLPSALARATCQCVWMRREDNHQVKAVFNCFTKSNFLINLFVFKLNINYIPFIAVYFCLIYAVFSDSKA